MGVFNHERHHSYSGGVISDHSKSHSIGESTLEMEDETFWRKQQQQHSPSQRSSPSKRSRSNSDSAVSSEAKHVSFDRLSIREYDLVLGDHPCCTDGPPVSLGWQYTESPSMKVEVYEATRAPQRRSRHLLRMNHEKRRAIVSEGGASEGDVRRVQRRLNRERCCSDKTLKSFFASPATTEW